MIDATLRAQAIDATMLRARDGALHCDAVTLCKAGVLSVISATAAIVAQRSMNDESYLAHRFCTAFVWPGHQCARSFLAEHFLVCYRTLDSLMQSSFLEVRAEL